MAENKTCKNCKKEFTVTDDDLVFYKKISPTFAGKMFEISAPTFCPDCRQQRRIVFRNERNLYKRKSDATGKEIVSMYPPDSPYTIYEPDEWWSDRWDGFKYGREYDTTKPFFEQFDDLLNIVPRIALMNKNSEDSDFSMYSSDLKNCYLIFSALSSENCHYGYQCNWSKDSMDIAYLYESELCYETVDSRNCYNCRFVQNCDNCSDISFAYGCRSCKNCFLCTNLVNKEYCFGNKQLEKDEYERKLSEFKWTYSEIEKSKKDLSELVKNCIHVFSHLFNCEDCTGDYLRECKNCKNCFDLPKSENGKYIWTGIQLKDCRDCCFTGKDAEFCLECVSAFPGFSNLACIYSWESSRLYYCDFCFSCKDCFGCAGLKNKQYCILNKQYSKEEYEKNVAQIIEKMTTDNEWGEFFPVSLSPFGYNISLANEFYPLSRDEASAYGSKWQEKDYSPSYAGEYLVPDENINFYKNNPDEANKLLSGIIKCEVSEKPFKIMPQELAFYFKTGLPIPRRHFDVRHKDRLALRNPRKLYHRQCMCDESGHDHPGKCPNEFETTYDPDRPEKVYCEKCYQKSVI